MTNEERKVFELALEALTHIRPNALTSFYTIGDRDKAITAMKELLAQPEQEPVAWMHNSIRGNVIAHRPADIDRNPDRWIALYTTPPQGIYYTPPQRKPLTTDQIWEIAKNLEDASWRQIVDAIEAAHGIKE